MPEVACSDCGVPGVQMLFSSPPRPDEPSLHRPASAPMSPIPGTLQIPLSGRSSTLLLVTASRTAGVALADSAAWAESADLANSAFCADCAVAAEAAARAEVEARAEVAEVAEVAEAAAGAEGALVAADAGRTMNSPPSTTVNIAAASSRARADRRA